MVTLNSLIIFVVLIAQSEPNLADLVVTISTSLRLIYDERLRY